MNEKIQELLENTTLNTTFRTHDIPAIDLYMDQIISLINGSFAAEGSAQKENQLTKTMIHNYSKEGLIKPVKGKKYTKEHILQMLMVYQLKNTIKISDIKDMLKALYQKDSYCEELLAVCFDEHMAGRLDFLKELNRYMDEDLCGAEFNCESEEDLLTLLLNLSTISYYFKCLTEAVAGAIAEASSSAAENREKEKPKK